MMIPNVEQDNMAAPLFLVQDIKQIAQQAARTITALQNKESCTFWRSTEHRRKNEDGYDGRLFPTVTFVSLEALIGYQFKYPEWLIKDSLDLNKSLEAILKPEVNSFKSSINQSADEDVNPFTLTRYIHVLSAFHNNRLIPPDRETEFYAKLKIAFELIVKKIDNTSLDQWHPFIIYHFMRSIQMMIPLFIQPDSICSKLTEINKRLLEQVRKNVLYILSQKLFGEIAASDAIALGFCAAALTKSYDKQNLRLILLSLEACFNSQDPSGCWPQGRVILDNEDTGAQPLIVSTYEIACVLSDTLSFLGVNRLISLRSPEIQTYINKLLKTLRNTQISIEHLSDEQLSRMKEKEPKDGWCAEHKYNLPNIESWTTSTVLNFISSLHDLIQSANQQSVIAFFSSIDPVVDELPDWCHWDDYRQKNEPEESFKVLDYLHNNIVMKILENPKKLPSKKDKDVSVLLFGPPGTHKTSIVQALAEGLKWPIVTLSPGEFIEKGLEYIEAQANIVFSRLIFLTQTVILFDECDELFRDREPLEGIEQMRAITAFVTASMLPKLQKLHDTEKVLFFICTNQIESMDNAVIRGGRIDHIIGIGPPDKAARLRILRELIENSKNHATIDSAKVESMMDCLAAYTQRFNRHELERAYNQLYPILDQIKLKDINNAVKDQISQMKNSLVITDKEFNNFEKIKYEYSRPHIERKKVI